MTELTSTQVQPGASVSGFEPGTEGVRPPTNPDRHGVFLTDVIVELGFADQDQVDTAERTSRESGKPIEHVLVENGSIDEEQLACAIAERHGLDLVDLGSFDVDMEAATLVGRTMAERYEAVPIAHAPDGALVVAVKDVFDTLGASDIEVLTRSEVRRVVAAPTQLQELIARLPDVPTQAPPPPAPAPEEEPAASRPDETPEDATAEEEPPEPSMEVPPVDEAPPVDEEPPVDESGRRGVGVFDGGASGRRSALRGADGRAAGSRRAAAGRRADGRAAGSR